MSHTPQECFEAQWIMSRTYAVNRTLRFLREHPEGTATVEDLLKVFERERDEAVRAFGKRVNHNGVVVPVSE